MVPKQMKIAMNSNQIPHRKKALAYIRISSQRQINGESPQTQESFIRQYASSNNIEIVDVFYDEAKSGRNTDRQELHNMIEYAKQHKGEIDHVIVYKMNRASRDIISYVTGFVLPLKNLGITIRSATEPIDESVFGQFMEGLSILLGQMDTQNKQGFTIDNMTSLALQGYWQHPPVVGYDTHKIVNDMGKSRPTLKPSPMAPLVKDVLERFSQGDITKAELTRYAASIGLRSRNGKKLSKDRINALIRHPVYAGYVVGNLTGGELVEGKHQALITKETYELNQILLKGKEQRTGEVHLKFNPKYPLKGLVLCPRCKLPLYASAPKTGAGGKSPRYHCSRNTCKGLVISAKSSQMHEDFEDMLKRIKPEEQLLELYKEVLITEAANQLGSLNHKISRVRARLNTIADERLDAIKNQNAGKLSEEDSKLLLDSLGHDKDVQLVELSKLEKQHAVQETDILLAVDIMRDVDKQWGIASLAAKARFQSGLFPKGLVYDPVSRRFGTTEISPLYRCIPTKKDLPEPEKSFLVAGAGLEPATLWL
jgi:site-specific DNA recombinase